MKIDDLMANLLPCPFCGQSACVDTLEYDTCPNAFIVGCSGCDIEFEDPDCEVLIKVWNRRAKVDPNCQQRREGEAIADGDWIYPKDYDTPNFANWFRKGVAERIRLMEGEWFSCLNGDQCGWNVNYFRHATSDEIDAAKALIRKPSPDAEKAAVDVQFELPTLDAFEHALIDAVERMSNEEIEAELREAGIDMKSALERLHKMIDEHKQKAAVEVPATVGEWLDASVPNVQCVDSLSLIKPPTDGWNEWDGGDCPVEVRGKRVEGVYNGAHKPTSLALAETLDWNDIIAYRVVDGQEREA